MASRLHLLALLRRGLVPQATALLLCLPLTGGRGVALMIDALVYPNGACCCERAHGRTHHCRCADPHSAEQVDAAHELGHCEAQCDDGSDEYGVPNLWPMPLATLSAPILLEEHVIDWHGPDRVRPMNEGLSSAPPTPPPDARQV